MKNSYENIHDTTPEGSSLAKKPEASSLARNPEGSSLERYPAEYMDGRVTAREPAGTTLRKALKSYLWIFPFALSGGVSVGIYMIEHSSEETIDAIMEQLGSVQLLAAVSAVQSVVYSVFAWVAGYFIAKRLGLLRPWGFDRRILARVVPGTAVLGLVFAADYFVVGRIIPEVAADYELGVSPAYFISALTYGGVIEEVLMRWFLMGLIALVLVMIFEREKAPAEISTWIFAAANVAAAAAFAAGHLPATEAFFGRIDVLILVRCVVLNGGFGLFFGRWYRKYGIQYAILGHVGIHLVDKIILLCVV